MSCARLNNIEDRVQRVVSRFKFGDRALDKIIDQQALVAVMLPHFEKFANRIASTPYNSMDEYRYDFTTVFTSAHPIFSLVCKVTSGNSSYNCWTEKMHELYDLHEAFADWSEVSGSR